MKKGVMAGRETEAQEKWPELFTGMQQESSKCLGFLRALSWLLDLICAWVILQSLISQVAKLSVFWGRFYLLENGLNQEGDQIHSGASCPLDTHAWWGRFAFLSCSC